MEESHQSLHTILAMCVHWTRALAHKLTQSSLLSKYQEIITDQEHCGFIEKVDSATDSKRCHYIPHHTVRKNPPTTPLRIVYDCSCQQSKKHPSLNDSLHTGEPRPKTFAPLSYDSSFQLHPIRICAGIKKAFLHIWLHKDDRD